MHCGLNSCNSGEADANINDLYIEYHWHIQQLDDTFKIICLDNIIDTFIIAIFDLMATCALILGDCFRDPFRPIQLWPGIWDKRAFDFFHLYKRNLGHEFQ